MNSTSDELKINNFLYNNNNVGECKKNKKENLKKNNFNKNFSSSSNNLNGIVNEIDEILNKTWVESKYYTSRNFIKIEKKLNIFESNKNVDKNLDNYIKNIINNNWYNFIKNKKNIIGKGSFGIVYKINYNNKVYALKCQIENNEDERNLFIREYNIVRYLLDSEIPNIINVINIYEAYNRYCMLSDYYEYDLTRFSNKYFNKQSKYKKSKSAYILDKNEINVKILEILKTLINTINKIHILNIVHRDIKTDNILIDENGNPFIADFGTFDFIYKDYDYSFKGTPIYFPLNNEDIFKKKYICSYKQLKKFDYHAIGVLLYLLKHDEVPYVFSKVKRTVKYKYQKFINETKHFEFDHKEFTESSIKVFINRLLSHI